MLVTLEFLELDRGVACLLFEPAGEVVVVEDTYLEDLADREVFAE